MIREQTRKILEFLEENISPEVETDYENQWREFLEGEFKGDLFTPKRKIVPSLSVEVPFININDAIEDYDLMLCSQLVGATKALCSTSGSPAIRANYGTGIMSSIMGAELFVMPRNTNTLPTTMPFDSLDKVEELISKGADDLNAGLGRKVWEFADFTAEVLKDYPKVSKFVHVYHPDLQGPLDICELIMGGEMFYAFYDDEDMVHNLLSLITDTYIRAMRKWRAVFPAKQAINPHWGLWHKGEILLRSDSAMNISPELYKQFSVPYDQKLLDEFNGGAVHFCGRGDHYIDILCGMDKMYAINMSQPEYNDMEKIYASTVDKGIKIVGFSKKQAEKDLERVGGLKSSVHVD